MHSLPYTLTTYAQINTVHTVLDAEPLSKHCYIMFVSTAFAHRHTNKHKNILHNVIAIVCECVCVCGQMTHRSEKEAMPEEREEKEERGKSGKK